MAIDTPITAGTTERSSTAFEVKDGKSVVVFTNDDLVDQEHITAERSYDGGTNWRPIPDAIVCSADKKEGRIYGPITDCRLTITATVASRTVYIDK